MAESETETTPKLTVLILARDVVSMIGETISAGLACGGEVIVVDTGSSDDTPLVAQRLGAKVVTQDWQENFATARNAALRHATTPWILWLDAGESLSAADAAGLKDFVENYADETTAYWLAVSIPAEGSNVGGEQIARVRLHPRRDGLQFVGRVRESLLQSLSDTGLTVEGLEQKILRGPREHDPAVKSRRARRNIRLAEMEMEEHGARPDLWNCLGEAYQNIAQPAESAACYRQAGATSEPKSPEQLEAYYGLLTALDSLGDDRQSQLQLCMEALEHFPLDSQLLCAMGGYLQSLGQDELASRSYDVAFKHGLTEPTVWHLPNILELSASCRAALLLHRDEAKCLAAVEEGLEQLPASSRLLRQKLDLMVRRGAKTEALAVLARMTVQPAMREALETAVHGACLAVQQHWVAARAYLQTALKAGLNDAICYRWLTVAQLAVGADSDARQTMSAWEAYDPHNPEIRAFRRDPRLQPPPSTDRTATGRRIDAPGSEVRPPAWAKETAATGRHSS